MYKGGGKGWDVNKYVSSLSTYVLKININIGKRYGVKKIGIVFDSDILDDVSLEMPNTI